MIKILKTCILPVSLLLLTSCANIKYQNQTAAPISFTPNLGTEEEYRTVRHVDNDYRRFWLVFYMIPIGKDGSDMIADSAAGADGMVNLTLKAQYSFVDVLVANLTFGLFCLRSVNVQGDLVEFTGQEKVEARADPRKTSVAVVQTGVFCSECGVRSANSEKFCSKCGKKLRKQ